MAKQDINSRTEIEMLVNAFYDKVKMDDDLKIMFSEVDWEKHLPVMYDFWENVMFHTGKYSGNPMASHQRVHQKNQLTSEHFKRWLSLFFNTAEQLFDGPNATTIKERAKSIATIMEMKITDAPKNN